MLLEAVIWIVYDVAVLSPVRANVVADRLPVAEFQALCPVTLYWTL